MTVLDRVAANGDAREPHGVIDPPQTGVRQEAPPARPQGSVRAKEARNRVRRFVLWCSGARPEVLKRTPSEDPNCIGLGSAVISTATFAAASSTAALAMALRKPFLFMLPIGFAWGLVIMSLDRWLVATAGGASARGKVLVLLPRMLLAGFIGLVIAEPLLLTIFDSEIQAKAVELRTRDATVHEAQLAAKYGPLLEQVDKRRASLQRQLKERETTAQARYRDAIGEAEGTSGTQLVGRGPVFVEKWRAYKREQAILDRLRRQTNDELARLRARSQQIQQAWDRAKADAEAAISRNNGLLLRISALDALAHENRMVGISTWVLRLFIVLIDCLAVLVKAIQALGGPRPYDKRAAAEERSEEAEAERVGARAEVELQRAATERSAAALQAQEQRALLTYRRDQLLLLIGQLRDPGPNVPIPHRSPGRPWEWRRRNGTGPGPAPSGADRGRPGTGMTSSSLDELAASSRRRRRLDRTIAAAVIAAFALILSTLITRCEPPPPPPPPPLERPCVRTTEPCGRILSPIGGTRVPRNFTVEGVLAKIPPKRNVWLAVQIGNHLWPKEPKIPSSDSHWSQEVVEAGSPPGDRFSIVLLMVNDAGDREIRRWLQGTREGLTRISGSKKLDVVGGVTLE
jgi:Domain of unknown function (DUF4407)